MRASRLISIFAVPAVLALAAANGLAGAPVAADAATSPAAAAALTPSSALAWGDNSAGELGNGTLTASTTPAGVGGSGGVQAISVGGRHVLALGSGGTVLAWGDNTSGQLGNGTTGAGASAENPVAVKGLTGVTQVSAGAEHSLAVLSNGTVMAWGDNSHGELGNGTTTSSAVPVAVTGLTGVKSVAAGEGYSLAVLTDGRVMAWGNGGNGQLGDGKYADSHVPVAVSGLTGVSAVAAGGQHALALKTDGTARAWGANDGGQLGDGGSEGSSNVPVTVQGLSGAVAVAAGSGHSLALLSGGTVMAWGDNGFNQLGRPNGFPGGVGSSNVPLQVPGLGKTAAISAGGLFNLALLADGTVDGWGDGAFGQLGNGTTSTLITPTAVSGLTGTSVRAVAAGGVSSAAIVAAAAPVTPPPVPSIWQVTGTPMPRAGVISDESLQGVSASSTSSAWAVGTGGSLGQQIPLAEHWNGTSWKKVAAPLPAGVTTGSFHAVDALSAGNAWAVGTAGPSTSEQTLIEHWNGSAWTVVPSPNPGGDNVLEAIGGTGPSDLWAVGWFENTAQTFVALLFEHWNGTAWSFVAPPVEGGTQFGQSVTAIAPNDVWVVGDAGGQATLSAHWNGTAWKLVNTPFLISKNSVNFLTGVTATAPNNVWASGYEGNVNGNLFSQPYMLHWTGSSWHLVKLPNAGTEGSTLHATHALSATDIWSVGITGQTDGAQLALTEHFNGTTWSIKPALDPGQLSSLPDNSLSGVASPAPGIVWAVGAQEITGQCCIRTLAEMTAKG
jgi:alpha-tubulin suppressor-like RCC1 family protein